MVKCIEDEIPFDVPEGWEWTRLGVICPYGNCTNVDTKNIKDDEWILDLEDIEKDTGKIISIVLKNMRPAKSNKHKFYKGQLLYSKLRPYLNKVVIAPRDGYCTSEILPLEFYSSICPEYMQIFLMSSFFLSYVNLISYGLKMPRLGTSDGLKSLIALPPLNEQKLIVFKTKEVIAFIENLKVDCINLRQLINLIKSKILDLAIRGQLVPQDPNDEPASALLERIRAEKEELIKQGKIKRNKKESVIFKGDDNSYYEKIGNETRCIDENLPFALPNGWEWCNLSMVGQTNIGLTYKPNDKNPDGVIVLRSSNIVNGKIDFSDLVKVSTAIAENQYVHNNDILICARNGSKSLVGKCAIIENINEPISFGAFMAVYRTQFYEYIYYFLNSSLFREVFNYGNSTTINQLTQEMIKNAYLPFPPYFEQVRINKKIKNIFNIIDSLEKNIK
jgi:type I restriction enzyme S subunit